MTFGEALDEKKFLALCVDSFRGKNIGQLTEKEMQLAIANALVEAGLKVFCEYPYPKSKDKCDIVLTKKDYLEVTHWIEIKPVWENGESNYWSLSKFFGEAPFREDIRKLSNLQMDGQDSKNWFLAIIMTEESIADDLDAVENPGKGKALAASQMVKGISFWANGAQPIKAYSKENKVWFLLWPVEKFNETKIVPNKDGIYDLG